MTIVWDEPKRLANLAKHGLDFADLDETFFDNALVSFGRVFFTRTGAHFA